MELKLTLVKSTIIIFWIFGGIFVYILTIIHIIYYILLEILYININALLNANIQKLNMYHDLCNFWMWLNKIYI